MYNFYQFDLLTNWEADEKYEWMRIMLTLIRLSCQEGT